MPPSEPVVSPQQYLLVGWPLAQHVRLHISFHDDLKTAALNFIHMTTESRVQTGIGHVGGGPLLYSAVVLYLVSLENPLRPLIQVAGNWQLSPD